MYKTIEKQKNPLDISSLAKYIEEQSNLITIGEIVSFQTYGMKKFGRHGYKIIFLVKLP